MARIRCILYPVLRLRPGEPEFTRGEQEKRLLSISGGLKRAAPVLASSGLAAAIGLWYFGFRTPAVPHRTLRIGYENVPPVQMVTEAVPPALR